jgi:foldase protein PrsA
MLKRFKGIKKSKYWRFLKIFIGIVVIGLVLYSCRSFVLAAWVGRQPVFRWSVVRELEKQGGKTVIENLIERSLIFQEAAKNKIAISDKVIAEELARIEDLVKSQGSSLDEALSLQGQKKEDFIDRIKLQKTVESLLSGRVSISENEIEDFYQKNENLFGEGTTFEKVKDQVKNQLLQAKLAEEYQKWISELKTKAKIFYFVKY